MDRPVITITAFVRLHVKEDGQGGFVLLGTDLGLQDSESFVDEKGLPNKDGCEMITTMLTEALIANIQIALEKGYRKNVEHLRSIIKRLEVGTFSIGKLYIGNTEDGFMDASNLTPVAPTNAPPPPENEAQ